ncbi:cell division protein FtsY [Achromatium sp. WMS3]|nr:cell division protein FtsY [Achromatium sp. WMS3]
MFGFSKSTTSDKISNQKETPSLFGQLKNRLTKVRHKLSDGLTNLLQGRKRIDADLLEELETLLITADIGMETTQHIIKDLTNQVQRKILKDPQALTVALKSLLLHILQSSNTKTAQPVTPNFPQVILVVGINGAGKTTTIGKLAKRLQQEGKQVMLAAGDTFRAAAIEQLQVWGERNEIPVICQHQGADSASVIYDALESAIAKGQDVLIADTAGRLHTKSNLMAELSKIGRVLKKLDPDAPHEVLLVIDATTGQNGLQQALEFNTAIPLTGVVLTKLDGTAKGGILFAIADRLQVPIRFIGVGEKLEDLRPFEPEIFVDAIFDQ